MRLETSIYQRQEMRLKLAPQIIQSIEILQLPTLALHELVRQEMLENPTIELVEESASESTSESASEVDAPSKAETPAAPEAEGEAPATAVEDGVPSAKELEAEFERLDGLEPFWREAYGPRSGGGRDGDDKKLEALQNTAAPSESLQDYVFQQFCLLTDDDREREIGEHLCYSLDSATGWLGHQANRTFTSYSLEELVASLDTPCTVDEAEAVLRKIQGLEPPGIGARDLTECLLIQLGDGFPLEHRLIERHLEDIKRNRLPKIAKATGRPIEKIKEAIEFIAQLNPFPGALFGGVQARHVFPDVICERVDGKYVIRLEDTYLPRIHVSSRYRRMLQEQKDNRAVRDYIKKKIESAKWLIDSIAQRQSTLRKIAGEIVAVQETFLDKGIDGLRPLKMQQIADKVGVHVSTVSRAIAEKWVQTPRGMYPLRFFFNGGTTTTSGDEESILAVKHKVRDIVDDEDKSHPLSDEEIAKRLKEMGYNIARRTVTKYRKQLTIPSSRQRREY